MFYTWSVSANTTQAGTYIDVQKLQPEEVEGFELLETESPTRKNKDEKWESTWL